MADCVLRALGERGNLVGRGENGHYVPMNAIVKIGDVELEPFRFNRDAIIQMVDSGVFEQFGRWEVIDGVMIHMSPSWLPHSRALSLVNIFFGMNLAGRYQTTVDQLVLFGDDGMHAPDIAVFEAGFSKRMPEASDLRLVIEIAEASLAYDLGTKADRYAAFGIPELWVVDLEGRRLVVHRDPGANGYGSVTATDWSVAASPLIAPEVTLTLADILDV